MYFRKIFITLLSLIAFIALSGCDFKYLYNKSSQKYLSYIYVDNIPELYGMMLRGSLVNYFNNTNENSAKYILKINTNINESTSLTNLSGFSSQKNIYFYVRYSLVSKKNNKVLFSSSSHYNGYYNVESSSYSTDNNKNRIYSLAAKMIANDIAIKVTSLLQKANGNLKNNN